MRTSKHRQTTMNISARFDLLESYTDETFTEKFNEVKGPLRRIAGADPTLAGQLLDRFEMVLGRYHVAKNEIMEYFGPYELPDEEEERFEEANHAIEDDLHDEMKAQKDLIKSLATPERLRNLQYEHARTPLLRFAMEMI